MNYLHTSIISNRLSKLFCNLDKLKKVIPPYKNAIKQTGYKNDLIFSKTQPKKEIKKTQNHMVQSAF